MTPQTTPPMSPRMVKWTGAVTAVSMPVLLAYAYGAGAGLLGILTIAATLLHCAASEAEEG